MQEKVVEKEKREEPFLAFVTSRFIFEPLKFAHAGCLIYFAGLCTFAISVMLQISCT